jgi:hypothetical protein
MHADTTYVVTPRPSRSGRTVATVAGAVAAVLAMFLLAVGGVLLWGDAQVDDDGYLSTSRESFTASTYAMRTDNLDVDLDGAGWFLDRAGLGGVRVEAAPHNGKPVFVGIARTRDVSAYLQGTLHTQVRDVSYSPFRVAYRERQGTGGPPRPADQRFWVASAQGAGTQTVRWDVRDGDWSVVVMNEDASRTVAAGVRVGAKAPVMSTAGWVAIGGGALLAVLAGVLLIGTRATRSTR